jgi:hypothetical protein
MEKREQIMSTRQSCDGVNEGGSQSGRCGQIPAAGG